MCFRRPALSVVAYSYRLGTTMDWTLPVSAQLGRLLGLSAGRGGIRIRQQYHEACPACQVLPVECYPVRR